MPKIAVVGSRSLLVDDLEKYLPCDTDEIVSGGATGIDECAKKYSIMKNIKYTEFLPDYKKYGRAAPIIRNKMIVDYSDMVIVFWDGRSAGTKSVIEYCKRICKEAEIHLSIE